MDGPVIHSLSNSDGGVEIRRHRDSLAVHCDATGQWLIDPGRLSVTVWPSAAPTEAIEHRIASLAVPLIISERGDPVLHATGLLDGERVVAVAGPSGAGKSTLAVASGLPVLAEDGLALEPTETGFTCWPGPRGARLAPDARFGLALPVDRGDPVPLKHRVAVRHHPRPAPLGAVLLLGGRGGRSPRAERLDRVDAVPPVLRSLIFAGSDRTAEAFRSASAIAREVPVWRVSVPDDLTGLPAFAAELFEAVRSGRGVA